MTDPTPRPTRRRPPRRRSGIAHALQALSAAQQRTAAAAVVVIVSLGTPWYSTQVAFQDGKVVDGTRSGIQAFSFVEAAVLLVAIAVLALVWARSTERRFSLPAGDGTVVTAAAGWLGLLIVYRLFDRPEGGSDGGTATLIGLSWGIFASLAAVGLLLATGLDQRRRDATRHAPAGAPPEGPVVDPGDLVAQPGASAAGGRAPGATATGLPADCARVAGPADARPQAGAPAPAAEDATRVVPDPRAGAAPAADPAPARPTPRSWSFDDPDLPAPPPATPPSRRRPTPPEDPTRALGRGDAAAQLREAGVGGTSAAGTGPDDPTRVAGRPDDATRVTDGQTDATRAAGGQGDATRVTDGREDATRVRRPEDAAPPREPRPGDRDPAPDPQTRVHGRPRRRPDA